MSARKVLLRAVLHVLLDKSDFAYLKIYFNIISGFKLEKPDDLLKTLISK